MKIFLYIVTISLLLLSPVYPYNQHNHQFETIDINQGLSLNSVRTIIKDKNGFMWFGTEDGLNRYDGISFKYFRHDPMDNSSINSNSIISMMVDSEGSLWIGTYDSGLNKYVDETESFLHYPHDPLDSLTLGEGSVWGLQEDQEGNFWVGTSGGGLFRLDPKTGHSQPVTELVSNGESLVDSVIYNLFIDHDQQLWISTLGGLNVLDLKTYAMRGYSWDQDDSTSLFDDNVNYVFETFDGTNYRLWIGTNWGGLDQYDPVSDSFIHHGYGSAINPDYPETSVNTMIQGADDQLWVGTDSKGIFILDLEGNLLEVIHSRIYDETALNDDVILSFHDDGDIIWIGTSSGGVGKYIRNRKKFYSLSYDPLNPDGLHDNRILRLRGDSKGNIWVATWTAGLSYYNPTNNTYKVYQHDPDDPGSLSDDGIQDILVDRHDNLWVISNSTSLDLLRSGSESFERIKSDPHGLPSEYLLTLYEDREGFIWIGSWDEGLFRLDPATMEFKIYRTPAVKDITLGSISYYAIFEDSRGVMWFGAENEGLIEFDREQETIKQYKASPGDPYTLPHDDVMDIFEDDEGLLWLATYGGGLSRFNTRKHTFKNYSVDDGLPSGSIYAIFADSGGELWMSTNNGLAKFNPSMQSFKNYGIPDGVLSQEFNPAACQLENGWIYFGGVKGITFFHPDQIEDNLNIPPVRFTDLTIMNQPISVHQTWNNRVVLEQAMTTAPLIELFPEDLFFGVHFASLDYYHSGSNNYAYILEGFDDAWRQNGHKRSVTFSNIPPGDYTLKIRSSNNDGIWNQKGTSLKLIVHPEFYETWWFISGVIFFVLLISFIFYRVRTNFLIQHSEELKRHNIQLNAEMESRRKAHVKARERANYFHAVISQSPVPMAIHNSEGHITHLNSGWVKLWGADSPETIIRDYDVDDDVLAQQLSLGKAFKEAVDGAIIEIPEVRFLDKSGNKRVVQMLLYPLKNKVGMINQVMVSLDDVTEVVYQRKLLEKSIKEKDLLLKEVHHRVKNNLQLVASLLGLQKAGTDNEKTMSTLDDIRNRVNSMALVHDALYRSPDLENVDISSYIQDLADTLQSAFRHNEVPIQIKTDIPEIHLSVDIAVPCGLMINELVTNALKYAFPDPAQKDKIILIQFTEFGDDCLRLVVLDNGVGLQKPVVWDSVESLGLYLVKILSENQLMGSVKIKEGIGAHFVIEFPMHPNFDD